MPPPLEQKRVAELPPLPKVRLSLAHRIGCFIQLWFFKGLLNAVFFIIKLVWPSSPSTRPTFVRRYPCRPNLECRFFFPPNYAAGKALPLYFNIHGGGFAFGDASMDDFFCAPWAARTGMLVANLNYRKAPLYPFPHPTHDVASVVRAVLDDDSLPIDKDRVTIAGFSAGANLALSAAQLPGLKEVVKAAVIYYPIVDFGHNPTYKLDTRPYHGTPKESLEIVSWCLDWGYVSVGQDRRDPILSPTYAKNEDLPPRIYMIGAEWDLLRLETQQMIHRLAGLADKPDQEESFEEGNYKWTLAKGCSHAFTHSSLRKSHSTAQAKSEEIYREAHEWLRKGGLL